MKNLLKKSALGIAMASVCAIASAGPVILGGDDLTDHGSRSAGGANLTGWLYIEKAVANVLSGVTRAGGGNYFDIIALGSSANPAFTGSNAGGAIGSAANVLGKSVFYVDGDVAINAFFAALAAGTINAGMLWMAGTNATNDLDANEGLALTANAAAINNFGVSGGGIMAHGSGGSAYGWLSALLPGIVEVQTCQSGGATLTAAGQAAFPGLSNANISSGPCHSSFTGNFGGLQTLGLDGAGRSFIIGGGAGTIIQCGQPNQPPCPPTGVPEPGSLPLVVLAALGLALPQFRRLRSSKTVS